MVTQIYHSGRQLNKDNASDTKASFLFLHLSISNDIISTKIYDKRDDCQFPFLDCDVLHYLSYGAHRICQII